MSSDASPEILIALSNAVVGREEEFESWYWEQHIPEVLALPGFLSARRYKLPGDPGPGAPYRYATIYEIEGSADEARGRLYSTPGLSSSETMDDGDLVMAPYVPAPAEK
ncbi:MAG: hypothetical protein QM604_10915 [Microbacterium sp.]